VKGAQVVPTSEADVLRRRWAELDRAGYERAGKDPFQALRDLGYSYGHAANPGMDGYVYRAWVRAPGVSQPLQATAPSLLVAMLGLLCRTLQHFERVLN
jgi:hypothetical protein